MSQNKLAIIKTKNRLIKHQIIKKHQSIVGQKNIVY